MDICGCRRDVTLALRVVKLLSNSFIFSKIYSVFFFSDVVEDRTHFALYLYFTRSTHHSCRSTYSVCHVERPRTLFWKESCHFQYLGIAVGCIYKSYWIEWRESKSHLALLERRSSLREYESQDTKLAELRLDESINWMIHFTEWYRIPLEIAGHYL